MTREDLFLAIGMVEESRLQRSELEVTATERKPKKTGRIFRNFLIAAIIVSMLAVTAYAARRFGLKEWLSELGMTNLEELDAISVTIQPQEATLTYDRTTNDAAFVVQEAILDDNSIYVAARIVPMNENCILVPDIAFDEDIVTSDGLTLDELRETKASIVYAGIRCENSDGSVDGLGYSFKIGENGDFYYYISGQNTYRKDSFELPCRGLSHTGTIESKECVDFSVMLHNKSNTTEKTVCIPEERMFSETEVQVNSISFSETELCIYVTFNYTLPEEKYEFLSLRLVGTDGKELSSLPGFSGGEAKNISENTFEATRAYQKPLDINGLKLIMKDVWKDTEYGPYAIEMK